MLVANLYENIYLKYYNFSFESIHAEVYICIRRLYRDKESNQLNL